MSAAKWLLWFGLQWGGSTPRVLHLLSALNLPFCITSSLGVCVAPSAWGLPCMLSLWVLRFGCSSGFPNLWIRCIVACICPHMKTWLPAWCFWMLIWWCFSRGMDCCLCPGRCSWVGMRETAHWANVVVNGKNVPGACSIGRGAGRFVTICTTCQSFSWGTVTAWVFWQSAFISVLLVQCASRFAVTLGIGASTHGMGASALGRCIVCHATWVVWTLLQLALAFAALFLAIAILVNSLLIFCNASVVLLPVGMFPWSAIVSSCVTATTWDSGEKVGFVMYWCLKNTASLICVTHVFGMYTWKHLWCSIDVPRLNPASDCLSHVWRSSVLMWAWNAQLRDANGLFM